MPMTVARVTSAMHQPHEVNAPGTRAKAFWPMLLRFPIKIAVIRLTVRTTVLVCRHEFLGISILQIVTRSETIMTHPGIAVTHFECLVNHQLDQFHHAGF